MKKMSMSYLKPFGYDSSGVNKKSRSKTRYEQVDEYSQRFSYEAELLKKNASPTRDELENADLSENGNDPRSPAMILVSNKPSVGPFTPNFHFDSSAKKQSKTFDINPIGLKLS